MAKPLYSTSFNISQFSGLNQTGDGYNMNMAYAREMENVNIQGGSFQPMREGRELEQKLHDPIGTLAYLHRRWGTNTGTLLIAISNGNVYAKTLDGDDGWDEEHPLMTGLSVSDCDWVTYEISLYPDFSSEKAYVKGQRIRKPGTVYKCTTAIETAEEWDAEHWTEVSGADADLYPPYDATATYALDDVVSNPVTKNYRATDDVEAGAWDSEDWDELTGTDPVDILLFSNATDGMYCLYGDTLDVVPVETPKKFGVLARYNERVWGAGIIDDPDMLVYSVPYDPFDWSQNDEFPEDGAGDIQQPSWDGDSFVALRQYGNVLLAIKRNSIWRISGTNPGEFTMQQQYGGGTIAENTIAVYNDYAYMLGEYGIMQYNGSGAFPFQQEALQLLMREQLSRKYDPPEYSPARSYYLGEMCMHNGKPYRCTNKIYLDVYRDYGDKQTAVDAASEYSSTATYAVDDVCKHDDDCWICIEAIETAEAWTASHWSKLPFTTYKYGEDWTAGHWSEVTGTPMNTVCAGMWNGVYCLALPTDGSWYCNTILQYDTANRTFSLRKGVSVASFLQINERLFYTSATYPGTVFELDDTQGKVLPVKWISGYQDLGQKSSIKSAFIAYLMVDSPVPVELYLGMRTEKKLKQKRIVTKPGKMTRAHLNCQGREFRLEIESHDAIPYVIAGGIKIDLELDPD